MSTNDHTTPTSTDDRLMSIDDVAAYVAIPKATLYRWRVDGLGPVGTRLGRHLRYRRSDVDAWIESRKDGRRVA